MLKRLWQHKWWVLAVLAGLWWVRPRNRYQAITRCSARHGEQSCHVIVLDRWTGTVTP